MQFVIDENIPVELTDWLKKKDHVIFCVPKGNSDEEVATVTKKKRSVLLTLNRHFSNTLRFPPKDFPGIIRIGIHPSYIEDIISSLENFLNKFSAQKDFVGKLFILEEDGFFKLRE